MGNQKPPQEGGQQSNTDRKATFRVTHCNGKERGPAVLRLDDDGTGGTGSLKGENWEGGQQSSTERQRRFGSLTATVRRGVQEREGERKQMSHVTWEDRGLEQRESTHPPTPVFTRCVSQSEMKQW